MTKGARDHDTQTRLNRLFAELPSGVLVLDGSGQVVRCNPKAAAILGTAPSEITGRHASEWLQQAASQSPNQPRMEPAVERIHRAIRAGERFKGPMPIRMPAGHTGRLDITVIPPDDEDRSSGAILVLETDDTHQAEGDRVQTDLSLFDEGPFMLIVWGTQEGWPLVYASPNFLQKFGYSHDELERGEIIWAELLHPQDIARARQELSDAQAAQEPSIEQTYRLRDKSGQYRWIHDYTLPEYDLEGNVVRLRGYLLDTTRTQEALEELKRKNASLELAQQATSFGIWSWYPQEDRIWWDAGCWRMLGYRPSDQPLTFEQWRSMIHPDDLAVAEPEAFRQMAEGAFSIKFRYRCADGGWLWVHGQGRAVESTPDGSPIRMIGTHSDIQPLKERELFEERLASLADALPGMLYQLERSPHGELRFTYASHGARTTYGFGPEEIVADAGAVFERIHPEDRADVLDATNQSARTLSTWRGRFRICHPERGEIWVEGHSRPQASADGRVQWAGYLVDISDIRATEEALRRSEQRFRRFADAIDLVFWIRTETAMQYVSPAYERIWGRDLRELYRDPEAWLKAVHPEDTPRVIEASRAEQHQGIAFNQAFRIIRPDGAIRWIRSSSYPMEPEQEGDPTWSGVARDITDDVATQEALESASAELQRSNSELEQFAYVVSHDLRQPLRMVRSYSDLLRRNLGDTLDSDSQKMLGFLTDGAERMDKMLVALLEYSRVGRKGGPLEKMEVREAVDEALLFLQPDLSSSDAKIQIEGDWPSLTASRDELVRLFQNLVGNAIKYRNPDVPPEVTLSAMRGPGTEWHFVVDDNGIGIDPDQVGRLFQVFQRLHGRDHYPGNGVGLALCRKIVERHGGWIEAESTGSGQGSRFHFALSTDMPSNPQTRVQQRRHGGRLQQPRGLNEELVDLREAERLAGLGHWVSYPGDEILLWSRMVYELTGFEPASDPPDLDTYRDRILPADRHNLLEDRLNEASMAENVGRVFEGEYRFQLPDGRVRWLHERARVEQHATENRLRLRGILQDITGTKAIESALARREWELAEAQRIAHVGDWISDFVAGEIRWSAEVYRIFGMSKSQWGATHEAFMAAVHPEDRDRVQKAVDDALANIAPYNIRHRIVRPDGSTRVVQQRGEVEFDGAKPLRMVGTVLDITELHHAQQALRHSEELFRMAQQAAGFGVWEWDITKDEGYWDGGSWALLGYDEPRNKTLGYQDWLRLVHPDDVPRAEQTIEQGLNEGGKFSNEIRYRTATGGWQWVQHRGQLLARDTEGNPARMVGTHVDIDMTMQAREALRNANHELQAITNAMAHHFQEPTRRILSYAQRLDQLLDGACSPDVTQSIRFLTDQSHRLSHLVAQVHQYLAADIRTGVGAGGCDAREVLRQWVANHRRDLDAAEAQVEYPDYPLPLKVGCRHVRVVFGALLDNALRYRHPDRPARVRIDATLIAGRYQFSVMDNGPGLPEAQREAAFDLFKRFVRRSEAPDGLGIGLAIFRKTVVAHGGTCTIGESREGGARFVFDLPAAEQKELQST